MTSREVELILGLVGLFMLAGATWGFVEAVVSTALRRRKDGA